MPLVSHEVVEARSALYSRGSFVGWALEPSGRRDLVRMYGNREFNDRRTSSKLPLRRRSARLPSIGTSARYDNSRRRLTATRKTANKRLG